MFQNFRFDYQSYFSKLFYWFAQGPITKKWSFPLACYKTFLKEFGQLFAHNVHKIPITIVNELLTQQKSRKYTANEVLAFLKDDITISSALYPFQVECVRFYFYFLL